MKVAVTYEKGEVFQHFGRNRSLSCMKLLMARWIPER